MAQYRNVTEFLTKIRETYNKAREEYTLLNDRLDKIEALRKRDIARGWSNAKFQQEDTETYQKNKAEIKKQLSELINNTNAEYEKSRLNVRRFSVNMTEQQERKLTLQQLNC